MLPDLKKFTREVTVSSTLENPGQVPGVEVPAGLEPYYRLLYPGVKEIFQYQTFTRPVIGGPVGVVGQAAEAVSLTPLNEIGQKHLVYFSKPEAPKKFMASVLIFNDLYGSKQHKAFPTDLKMVTPDMMLDSEPAALEQLAQTFEEMSNEGLRFGGFNILYLEHLERMVEKTAQHQAMVTLFNKAHDVGVQLVAQVSPEETEKGTGLMCLREKGVGYDLIYSGEMFEKHYRTEPPVFPRAGLNASLLYTPLTNRWFIEL